MEISELRVGGYERVVQARDEGIGFHAIIAVHSTLLGPALGGLRMWPYRTEGQALTDVLRLARGMTYKSAVARTNLGGGKSVLIGDSRNGKSPELFRAMGRFIEELGGMYITAEDVGTSVEDMDIVGEETRWVMGRSRHLGSSGDPSPFTAHGVYLGIAACVEEVYGERKRIPDLRVAVQGLGNVGLRLCRRLVEDGASVVGTDIQPEKVEEARRELGIEVVDADAIYDVECDVFSPCALGAVINDRTIPRLRCRIVAGAANNQLLAPDHGDRLFEAGILYAPDYVINAGGIVNVAVEVHEARYSERLALKKVENIDRALKEVFAISRRSGIATHRAAAMVAERRLEEGRRNRERHAAT